MAEAAQGGADSGRRRHGPGRPATRRRPAPARRRRAGPGPGPPCPPTAPCAARSAGSGAPPPRPAPPGARRRPRPRPRPDRSPRTAPPPRTATAPPAAGGALHASPAGPRPARNSPPPAQPPQPTPPAPPPPARRRAPASARLGTTRRWACETGRATGPPWVRSRQSRPYRPRCLIPREHAHRPPSASPRDSQPPSLSLSVTSAAPPRRAGYHPTDLRNVTRPRSSPGDQPFPGSRSSTLGQTPDLRKQTLRVALGDPRATARRPSCTEQTNLAGGLDERFLWAPPAGRGNSAGRGAPGRPGTAAAGDRAGVCAPRLRLPRHRGRRARRTRSARCMWAGWTQIPILIPTRYRSGSGWAGTPICWPPAPHRTGHRCRSWRRHRCSP